MTEMQHKGALAQDARPKTVSILWTDLVDWRDQIENGRTLARAAKNLAAVSDAHEQFDLVAKLAEDEATFVVSEMNDVIERELRAFQQSSGVQG